MGEIASYMGVLRNASRNKPEPNLKDEQNFEPQICLYLTVKILNITGLL